MLGNYTDLMRMQEIPVLKIEENIPKLLQSVVDSFAPRFIVEKKTVSLDCQVKSFAVDRNIFKQMVHNMIEHTLFFADPGSQTMLTAGMKDQAFILELRYAGGGITSEQLEKIFEAAERVVDQKNGVKYNKGFGLSYNQLMALHVGGAFSFSIDPETLEHHLQLKLT